MPFNEASAVHVLQRLAYDPSARDLAKVFPGYQEGTPLGMFT
ncbi:hypothetical protein OV207_19140 [Corallococcus sp. BB11-1]|nr:hypothetical protein [Corallococcus sp. BB11-1]MCY1033575.1 hypothetical protein [Corallococcus sp. BB11-1]